MIKPEIPLFKKINNMVCPEIDGAQNAKEALSTFSRTNKLYWASVYTLRPITTKLL